MMDDSSFVMGVVFGSLCAAIMTATIIFAGDFNSSPISKVYKYLTTKGFKSTIKETFGREIKTWPSNKPETCIDYIWVKGENVEICSAETFGESFETKYKNNSSFGWRFFMGKSI